ncbi:hypothetical protein HYS72_03210 [Candidatus Pacearchaeota archaeon]|nr:hypothetical protein [Candidatus Pacearchaeota archaeon]
MKLIKKQINFYSPRRNLPEELVKTLEYKNSTDWNRGERRFERAPRGNLSSIVKNIFAEELGKSFKNAGYDIVLSPIGFYSSNPEKFVLEIDGVYFFDVYSKYLPEGFQKRSNLMWSSEYPIVKAIPEGAKEICGKIISDENDGFKDPAKIINYLKNAGYDAFYKIIEKSKKTVINVNVSGDDGYCRD